jgi:HD superfamily phosphodiesterase
VRARRGQTADPERCGRAMRPIGDVLADYLDVASLANSLGDESEQRAQEARPHVARVSVATLDALRGALRGAKRADIDRLDAELEHLIAIAKERAWQL